MVIMDTTESIGSLEEEAHKRKQRLKNLKRKNPCDKAVNDSSGEIVQLPKPKFRSYKPQDDSLKEAKLEDAEPAAVEDEVKDLLEAGKEKTGFGIPDYIQPDDVLDRVTAILGPTPEALYRQYSGFTRDMSVEEADDLCTIITIPPCSDDEAITGAIDCVEVGVGERAEGEPCCTSGTDYITNTSSEPRIDVGKRAFIHRTSAKLLNQNLLAKEVESHINRNNANADYYMAKKMKIDQELKLNRERILLEKKKIELEILELENEDSIVNKDKLLLEK